MGFFILLVVLGCGSGPSVMAAAHDRHTVVQKSRDHNRACSGAHWFPLFPATGFMGSSKCRSRSKLRLKYTKSMRITAGLCKRAHECETRAFRHCEHLEAKGVFEEGLESVHGAIFHCEHCVESNLESESGDMSARIRILTYRGITTDPDRGSPRYCAQCFR